MWREHYSEFDFAVWSKEGHRELVPTSKYSPNGQAFRNQLTSFVVGNYVGSSCKVADSDDDISGSVAIQIGPNRRYALDDFCCRCGDGVVQARSATIGKATSNGMGRVPPTNHDWSGNTATQPPVERLFARRLHTLSSETGRGVLWWSAREGSGVAERYGCTSGSGRTPPFRI